MASDKLKFVFNGAAGGLDLVQDVTDLVEGPASATDNAIAVYDSTTGKLIKNSSASVQTDGRVTAGADGSSSLDLITKQQLDAAIQGVDVKDGARAATTVDITLSAPQTIDTVAVIAGDRVLVKNQSAPAENGVYIVAAGAWSRASDSNTAAELNGALVTVAEGSQANTGWYQSAEIVTLDTDPVTFNQFFGAGTYVADGNGIELSGSTFSLELDGSTLSKSATGLKVATEGIANNEVASGAAIAVNKLAALTASRAVASDGSGFLVPATTTATELDYVSGVTSAIQTQLNGKEASFSVLPISKGGTNSGTALNNDRIIISSGSAIVENAAITASRALQSNASGIPEASTVTTTELGYLSGVTSAIQTQLGNFATKQLDNLGTTAINADLIFNKATATIKSANSAAALTDTLNLSTGDGTGFSSGALNINTGTSDTNASGTITLASGTSSAGASGNLFLRTGAKSGAQTGASGAVTLSSGDYSSSSNSVSGIVTIKSGDKSGSGTAATGAVTVRTGSSTATSNAVTGDLTLQSGDNTGVNTGVSGNVILRSGLTTNGNKNSGNVTVTTGTTEASSGNVSINTAAPGTGFNSGTITVGSGTGSNTSGAMIFESGTTAGSSAAATTGNVTIRSGANSGSSTGVSGTVAISSGNKTTGTANSGPVTIATGTSTATSGLTSITTGTGVGASGAITKTTGAASAGTSGLISGTTGSGTTASGAITNTTGNASAGTSGVISSTTGTGTTATGAINLTTGNASAGDSGSVVLTTGTATGTRGSVSVNALNLNMNSTKIINVTDPSSAQDAATMAYADTKQNRATLTTKGDLYVATALNTTTRMPAGTDGNFLKADSSVANGLVYASTVTVFGSRSITSTDTLVAATDDFALLSGASFTLNLPTAVGNSGKRFTIKHNGTSFSQIYTIDGDSSETIDGATTYLLYTNTESVTIISDGANWHVLDHKTNTAPVSYSPTITGHGTVSNNTFYWNRRGNYMEIQGSYTTGTVTTAILSYTLPGGTLDTAAIGISNTTAAAGPLFGFFIQNGGGHGQCGVVTATGTSTSLIYVGSTDAVATGLVPAQGDDVAGSTRVVSLFFKVPISGWLP